MSLSEYVLSELMLIASQPTISELSDRIALRGRVDVPPAAEMLREARAGAK